MKALIPFLPPPGLLTANTMAMSPFLPEVMNCLTPFSTQWSPSRRAVVRIAEASEPTCGSVRQKQPNWLPLASGLRNRSFCSCDP